MVTNENKIAIIFDELKTRGFVHKNRKIKPSKRVFWAFKAGLFNSILYDKNFEKQFCDLTDDELRFIILHEEGHIVGEKCVWPPLITIFVLALIPPVVMFFTNTLLESLFICYSLLFIFYSIKILKDPLSRDEYKSDEFAGIILRNNFKIDKPSEVVNNAFNSLTKIYEVETEKKKPSKLRRWFISVGIRLEFAFFTYHPSVRDRVKNIREKYDSS